MYVEWLFYCVVVVLFELLCDGCCLVVVEIGDDDVCVMLCKFFVNGFVEIVVVFGYECGLVGEWWFGWIVSCVYLYFLLMLESYLVDGDICCDNCLCMRYSENCVGLCVFVLCWVVLCVCWFFYNWL